MRLIRLLSLLFLVTLAATTWLRSETMAEIRLPEPKRLGPVSVEEAIQKRRSVRAYSAKPLSLAQISQILWACQGITEPRRGLRSSPSAGALYPLELYLLKNDGVFLYEPGSHALRQISPEDRRTPLAHAAFRQEFIADAPVILVIAARYDRVTSKYGKRGVRYTDMEAGHAAENVLLQAVALGLDSVVIGAFDDAVTAKILSLSSEVTPLYFMPVGYKK